ncbi:unnamed protein product [Parajaminaea phylloscopi]
MWRFGRRRASLSLRGLRCGSGVWYDETFPSVLPRKYPRVLTHTPKHSPTMSKSVLIFLAHGTEELEFVATYDVLVRAGAKVTSVFVGSSSQQPSDPHGAEAAECTRGVRIVPDARLTDLAGGKALEYDAVVVPGGGPGSKTIAGNPDVQALLAKYYADGKVVAAICAGSLAIKESGIAQDSEITSHPSVKDELSKDYRYSEERVVVSDNLITSRGPGTAILFALTLVEKLFGKEKRDEVAEPMIVSSQP